MRARASNACRVSVVTLACPICLRPRDRKRSPDAVALMTCGDGVPAMLASSGATTAHVRVDIGSDQVVTASITNDAVDELGIKAGSKVTVVIKASDVMIGVD